MTDITTILKKELLEIWRDPYTLGAAFVLPLVLLFLFASAFNLDVKNTPLAVVDLDRTSESRAYIDALFNSDKFKLKYFPDSPEQAERLLDQGRAQAIVVIPRGFSSTLLAGDIAEIQTLVDGIFPTSARVIEGYVEAINAAFTARLLGEHFRELGSSDDPLGSPAVEILPRVRYNPAQKSANFIVPGLIGVILMAFTPLLSALAIVREKERGSIQQIFVSPLKSGAFILGKLLPYGAITYVELLLILLAIRYWFNVPMAGNPGYFLIASVPYVISTVTIGLLVSTVTSSQLTAMLMAIVLTMMPAFIFSGFMFPIYTMPRILQVYSYFFPARYFSDITYATFLRGVGPEFWSGQLLVLIAYMSMLVVLSSIRFKKKVS